jgi:hypothetical protein
MNDVMVNWMPAECLPLDRPCLIPSELHVAGMLQFFAVYDGEADDFCDICDLCGGYE